MRKLADFHKRRIGSVLPLRNGVNLAQTMKEIEAATLKFWAEDDAQSRYENIELAGDVLFLTRRRYKTRGAPPKEALRSYIKILVTIYEHATGKRIGRNVPSDAYADRTEKAHPFLAACMKAAGKAYSRRIMRELLQRPTRKPTS
jgi:hypothetical protein